MNILKIVKNKTIFGTVSKGVKFLNTPIFIGIMLGISIISGALPMAINISPSQDMAIDSQENSPLLKTAQTIKVVITAYSSTPEETDDTPFITASGKKVSDGIVANNMLPMGTQIRIPELYGDKVFIVEDRMNRRKSNYHIDIWFPEKQLALNFGVKTAEIEVLSPYGGSPEGREN